MKKALMFAIAAALLIAMTVPGYSWTGRMAGMGNPYGLVEDESDFLTHPTAITQGKGWQFYGDLGITYNDVTKWDYSALFPPPTTSYAGNLARSAKGDSWNTDASFGFTFPVNTGRMGFFGGYSGNFISRAKYNGTGISGYTDGYSTFDLKNNYDSFYGKVSYAQPFTDKVKFGGEFEIAYKKEKNENFMVRMYGDGSFAGYSSNWANGNDSLYYLFPYMLPYDSKYWEANMKASVEGMIGSSKLNFTVFGGFILSGDNDYEWNPGYGTLYDLNGSVSGWRIGADAWWRFPVTGNVAIPVLAKVAYAEKKRNGSSFYYDYNNKEELFNFELGGGVDAKLGKAARIATGLYYGYTDNKYKFSAINYNYSPFPQMKEHRVTLKVAGEMGLTPAVALNGGFNFFYGWVKQDFDRGYLYQQSGINTSFDGHTWGIGLSAGATFKFNGFVIEPYLKGAYQRFDTSGDGSYFGYPITNTDYKKTQWNLGGGFAIKFN